MKPVWTSRIAKKYSAFVKNVRKPNSEVLLLFVIGTKARLVLYNDSHDFVCGVL